MPNVTEAGNDLPEPIDRAPQTARPVTGADLDWLATRRVACPALRGDAAALVSDMRDEEGR
jgi:hypothetical protein